MRLWTGDELIMLMVEYVIVRWWNYNIYAWDMSYELECGDWPLDGQFQCEIKSELSSGADSSSESWVWF